MKKEIKIPKSLDERGYTSSELKEICKKFDIKEEDFNEALGVNTACVNELGEILTYHCDVENALSKIMRGYYIFWD